MISLFLGIFLLLPALTCIWWIYLDLRYKHKQGLKRTVHQHIPHILFCGWTLLLILAGILVPAVNAWTSGGVLMLLSGIFCLALALWDLHAVIMRHYNLELLQLRTTALGRIGWIVPAITGGFGILFTLYGIIWVIEIVSHTMLNPLVSQASGMGLMILSILLAILTYNVWRDEAFFKAAQQLQSMPEGIAREIVSTILEGANEKHLRKRVFFWQLYQLLIGLWPPCLMILLLVWYWFGYISPSLVAAGWTLIGAVAVVQTLSRMRRAEGTLPPVSVTHKAELLQYILQELIDGIFACGAGILVLIFEATRPFSIPAVSVIVAGILIFFGVIIYQGRKKRDRKAPKEAKQRLAPAPTQISTWRVGPFIAILRRTLSFCIVQTLLIFVSGRDLDLLMLLYWIVFAGFTGYITGLLLKKQHVPLQPATIQTPLEQTMTQ